MTSLDINLSQALRAALIGLVLWAAGVALVKFVPQLFDGSRMSWLMYAIAIPNGWATVKLIEILVRPDARGILVSTVIGCVAAMLCDGIAVTLLPHIYAGVSATTQFVAGTFLWVFAWVLIFALRAARSK